MDDVELTADERAGIRAYLQRSEVRLSTLHRVATALLSGAGLVVLLPAIERDSVVVVLRSLFADLDAVNGLLAAAMLMVLVLPLVALWMLLRELTRFYFHGQHLAGAESTVFVPRFTLTGLRLPSDELRPDAAHALADIRGGPENVELLVPAKRSTRDRIDRQLAAYEGVADAVDDDHVMEPTDDVHADARRAVGLLRLVASRDRSLLEEVAKVEYGMARHLLRIQTIVLRFVKALLVFVTTAIAVFAAAAVVGDDEFVDASAQVWLVAIPLVWAPCIVAAASTPVRWVEQLLRSEGATRPSVARDPELNQVERISIWVASAGWALAAGASAALLADGDLTGAETVIVVAVLVGTVVVHAGAVWMWTVRARSVGTNR